MSKKTLIDNDKTVELAFEELLELSTMELENLSFSIETNSKKTPQPNKNSYDNLSGIQKIIFDAKNKNTNIKKEIKYTPESSDEREIIMRASQKGKSAYDSDVLRELILNRQKQKRNSNNLSSLINDVKKNKDDYNK